MPKAAVNNDWSKFHVTGVDKESGFETSLTVDASDENTAKAKAELQGMVVTQVQAMSGRAANEAQSKALEDSASNQERKLYDRSPAVFRQHPIQVVFAVLLIPILVGVIWLAMLWLEAARTRLVLTNRRTTLHSGILSKSTTEVYHAHVRNVQVTQTFIQRLIGVGTIGIASAGGGGMEILVAGIPDPHNIKSIIDKYRGCSGWIFSD